MIRIEPKSISSLATDYAAEIFPLVLRRAQVMKYCLSHLKGNAIDVNASEFLLAKKMMENLIKAEFPSNKLKEENFFISDYQKTINEFIKNNFIIEIDLMVDLMDKLLGNDAEELRRLTLASASTLSILNKEMEDALSERQKKYFAKLFLDYQFYSSDIVNFFRKHSKLTICPYCNRDAAQYLTTDSGAAAETPDLDHFFSQTKHPFLSCSLFNLVPSCHACNKTNKRAVETSDKFFLNPYIDGFHKNLKFVAINDPITKVVSEIAIQLNDDIDDVRHKQIYGESLTPDEKSQSGNLNIFRIVTRYNRDEVYGEVELLIRKANPVLNGLRSLRDYLTDMGLEENQANYKRWYKVEMLTNFVSMEFNYARHSKLKRDVHDKLFENNTNPQFKFIIDLIAADYLTS